MTRPTHADLFCYLPLDTSLTDSLFSNRTDRTHREGPLRKPCRVLSTLSLRGNRLSMTCRIARWTEELHPLSDGSCSRCGCRNPEVFYTLRTQGGKDPTTE